MGTDDDKLLTTNLMRYFVARLLPIAAAKMAPEFDSPKSWTLEVSAAEVGNP